MSGSKLQAFPIPQSPLVDEQGKITNAWYRFFLTLVQRTGGLKGKVTPSAYEPSILLEGLFTGEESDPRQQTFWPADAFPPQENPVPAQLALLFGDVPKAVPRQVVPQDPVLLPRNLFLPTDPGVGRFRDVVPGDTTNAPPAIEAQAVGASPWTYFPNSPGHILVSGGTVGGITWSRDGAAYLATGIVAGFIPVEVTDSIIITYAVAPTVTLIRRPR